MLKLTETNGPLEGRKNTFNDYGATLRELEMVISDVNCKHAGFTNTASHSEAANSALEGH